MFVKKEKTGKSIEYPPYKCKLCGLGHIENSNLSQT